MTRFLLVLLPLVAVCAARPSEIQGNHFREVMAKLSAMRARSMELSRDDIRLATGLTVMSLVQKCEMYLYMNDLEPMELVANYYFRKNHSDESVLDHACPVVVLIVKEYMDADSEEEFNAVTDSLLPLMEEALCVGIVLNKEIMTGMALKEGIDLKDVRMKEIQAGEDALMGLCEDEFHKGDVNELADDLIKKLTEGDGGDDNGSGSGDRK